HRDVAVRRGGGRNADGTDTLWNIEKLRFCTSTDANGVCVAFEELAPPAVPVAPAAPTITGAEAGPGSVTVSFLPNGGSPFMAFEADALVGTTVVGSGTADGASPSVTITGLTNGTPVMVVVRSVNAAGPSANSAAFGPVTPVGPPAAPVIGTAALAGPTSATVSWTPPTDTGGSAITGYEIQAVLSGIPVFATNVAPGTSATVTGLDPGFTYTFQVAAINADGLTSPFSAESNQVVTAAPATAPGVPAIGTATRGNASATVRWTPPANDGGSPITRYQVQARRAGTTTVVGTVQNAPADATSLVFPGLTNGTAYDFRVRAVNAAGTGTYSPRSNAVTPATVPGAPTIGTAASGASGGSVTATARWTAPSSTGGSAITGYRVIARRMSSTATNATVLQTVTSSVRSASSRSYNMPLPVAGIYRFQVEAINAVGAGDRSARSNAVNGR
ncbi:fibronectin type III domain-containing protein, partial [Kineosporia sp. R_H_3]|uniref:fibronectin type III domain-containing protein n=1 Tax=Kineosporia sp. R_H_3 TaxID=1961848 RepID=UPI00117B5BFF